MSLYRDPSEPVTAAPEDWCYGKCRVAAYEDPDTRALMYRVEKESSDPVPEAYLVCLHMTPAYCRDLLAFIQAQEGGEIRANGCLLLIPGSSTVVPEAGTVPPEDGPEGGSRTFPDPCRDTPEKAKAIRAQEARKAKEAAEHEAWKAANWHPEDQGSLF